MIKRENYEDKIGWSYYYTCSKQTTLRRIRNFSEKDWKNFETLKEYEEMNISTIRILYNNGNKEAAIEIAENAGDDDDDDFDGYNSEISIDNGLHYMSADEISDEDLNKYWDVIVNMMDDEIREHVDYIFAPCSEREFLTEYLKRSPENLTIG